MAYREEEYPTTVRIDPFRAESPGLSMAYVGKQNVSYGIHFEFEHSFGKVFKPSFNGCFSLPSSGSISVPLKISVLFQ